MFARGVGISNTTVTAVWSLYTVTDWPLEVGPEVCYAPRYSKHLQLCDAVIAFC